MEKEVIENPYMSPDDIEAESQQRQLEQQTEAKKLAEKRRQEELMQQNERRARSGLFMATLMAQSVIDIALNTEVNPRARSDRRMQLHQLWRAFRYQLARRTTDRGVFGV